MHKAQAHTGLSEPLHGLDLATRPKPRVTGRSSKCNGFSRECNGVSLLPDLVELPNAHDSDVLGANEDLIPLENTLSLGDGTVMVVPYADVPIDLPRVKGVQRLGKQTAEALVNRWNTLTGKLARMLKPAAVYVGHPDSKHFANQGHTDSGAYAWIKRIEAGADALLIYPEWEEPGRTLLANKTYRWFSPFFAGVKAGVENGVQIYEPMWLKSVGLTNEPNWPVEPLVNQKPGGPAAENDGGHMDLLQRLIAILGLGKDGADDANEEGVVATVTKLVEAARKIREMIEARWDAQDAAYAAVPNEATDDARMLAVLAHVDGQLQELTNQHTEATGQVEPLEQKVTDLESALKAERGARVELLVNQAITDGRLKLADKDGKTVELVNAEGEAFETMVTTLVNADPVVKTVPKTKDLGKREATQRDRDNQIAELVNECMEKTGLDYTHAFADVRQDPTHAELFEEKPTEE